MTFEFPKINSFIYNTYNKEYFVVVLLNNKDCIICHRIYSDSRELEDKYIGTKGGYFYFYSADFISMTHAKGMIKEVTDEKKIAFLNKIITFR